MGGQRVGLIGCAASDFLSCVDSSPPYAVKRRCGILEGETERVKAHKKEGMNEKGGRGYHGDECGGSGVVVRRCVTRWRAAVEA